MPDRLLSFRFRAWDGSSWYGFTLWGVSDFVGRLMQEKVKAVCQYTGLKDKNGKDIYEGDIIKWFPPGKFDELGECPTYVVQWSGTLAAFTDEDGELIAQLPASEIEIIGNIYENEDLV